MVVVEEGEEMGGKKICNWVICEVMVLFSFRVGGFFDGLMD